MTNRIENAHIEVYRVVLTEPYRPPSRGGNTTARHSHLLVIDGQKYWFVALGSCRWVFKNDTVSFNYRREGDYCHIVTESLEVRDRHGKVVIRGLRAAKHKLRTATARLPVSRREARD